MQRADVIAEVRADLGEPVVKVELTDGQLNIVMNKALRWFKARKGIIKVYLLPLMSGVADYGYPSDAVSIVDVVLPLKSDLPDITNLDFFDIVPADILNATGPKGNSYGSLRFDTSSYVQLLQGLEMRRHVFNAQRDWYDRPESRIIHTQPSTLTGTAYVFYKSNTLDIPDLVGRDEDLIYRYCLSKAKMALGEMRSKYSSYPAAGGPISMNGAELKQEAKDELLILEEEISDSQGNAGGIQLG